MFMCLHSRPTTSCSFAGESHAPLFDVEEFLSVSVGMESRLAERVLIYEKTLNNKQKY
jgi:hypothetical protein